jgi:tetratricopeptide (TPR) repeat protein
MARRSGTMTGILFGRIFVADHFQYLACIAPIATAGTVIDRILGRAHQLLKPIGSIMLLLILCLLTWKQCCMYTDSATLYETIIRKNARCGMAYNNLGVLLAENGRTDEAILLYRKSAEIEPTYVNSLRNLAVAYKEKGQLTEAIHYLQQALNAAKASGDEAKVNEIAQNLERLNQKSRSFQEKNNEPK